MTSTDTTSTPPQGAALSAMRLPELKALAQQMGLKGLSGKRKGDLVAMIEGARGGRPAQSDAPRRAETPRQAETPREAETPRQAEAPREAEATSRADA
ncbi:transcription termination factor Rho, partial [Dietzia sp. E1]|nr:transcription termination factor Rho [Dietzia sp. E1]